MSIRYHMAGNSLKPGSFTACVERGRRIGLEAMIANIARRSSLEPAEVRAAATLLIEEVRDILAAGDTAVFDDLATFSVTLSGSYPTPDAHIERDRAPLTVAVRAASGLRAGVAARAGYERVVRGAKAPILGNVCNRATGSFDDYTPGGIVRLRGAYLKFDPVRADEGVFLRGEAGETRLTVYAAIGGRRVDALVPPGVRGPQQVIVRTRYTANGDLREGRYPHPVAQAPD